MRRLGALALLLVTSPLLAGCASDEPAVSLEALALATIAGTVTDVGLVPLEGATVRVDGANATARTDATGAFALRVPPGEYLVLASMEGFRGGALRAAPGAGETAKLAFTLAALPTESPQVVVAEQHGLLACGATVLVADQAQQVACGGNDPNQRVRLAFPVDATHGLMGAVVEVAWSPNVATAAWLDVAVLAGDAPSPLARSEAAEHVLIALPERVLVPALGGGAAALVVEVAPTGSLTDEEAGVDAGLAFQQPFAVYVSLFYHAAPPGGYAVVGTK